MTLAGGDFAMRATGKIAVVQEERFRLITNQGQGMLLTLSHKASASPEDLCRFHERHTEVAVEYSGEPNTDTGIAQAVREA